jgi:hypothetical protein
MRPIDPETWTNWSRNLAVMALLALLVGKSSAYHGTGRKETIPASAQHTFLPSRDDSEREEFALSLPLRLPLPLPCLCLCP